MALKLFELCGSDPDRKFSPYCWRVRMALAHKGLEAESIPWRFTEKDAIKPYVSDKVPVLLDGETSIADSWAIANHLEDAYPDRPSLFGGASGRAMARMLNSWGDLMAASIAPFIVTDVHGHLGPVDQEYFRKSREARFGKKLEDVIADRDSRVEGFRKTLEPVRMTLRAQPYLGGDAPNYADYIVFGPLHGRAPSALSSSSPKMIRSMHGEANCWMRSAAWRARPWAIRFSLAFAAVAKPSGILI